MDTENKRAVCLFCPVKDVCEAHRGKEWCSTCGKGLTCVWKDNLNPLRCETSFIKWHENLPRKCLLVAQQLATALKEPDLICRKELVECPRCLVRELTSVIQHSYSPLAIQKRKSEYTSVCTHCGLDVSIAIG